MKKILSLLVILGFVFIVSACAGKTTTVKNGTAYNWTVDPGQWDPSVNEYRPEAGANIVLWIDNEEWAEAIIAEYNKYFPEVTVTYEKVGSVDTRAKLALDGPAGIGADVIIMPHDHVGQALDQNIIGPVGNYEAVLRNNIVEASVKTVSSTPTGATKEVVYAFPISGESLALFYNKDILDDKGVDVATSFETIFSQSAQYTVYEGDNQLYWIGADVGNAYDMHFIATAFGFELFGPSHNDPDKANFNSTAMVNALTWHRNNFRQALNAESGALTGDTIKSLFEDGKMAYIIDGPWDIKRYQDAGLNFGVAKLPTIKVNNVDVNPTTFAGNQLAAVSRFTKYPAAARTFANFMASEKGAAIMYDVTGKLPVLKDASNIPGLADDIYLKGISEQLANSQPMPTIKEMSIFWQHAGSMYGNAWNAPDGMTPAQAAKKAQDDYDAARLLTQ